MQKILYSCRTIGILHFNNMYKPPSSLESNLESQPLLTNRTNSKSPKFRNKLGASIILVLLSIMLFLSLNIEKTSIFRTSLIKKMDFQENHREDKVSKVSNKGICSLIPSANHPSFKCSGEFLNFIVPATDEGKWPKGLSWTILEDAKDFQGIMGRVFIETGPKDVEPGCKSFSKVLCLEGNYILYVNSEDNSEENKENYYVDICSSDNRVKVGEALDFNANLFMCSEPNFEKTIPKQVEFAIKEPELSLSYSSNAQHYTEQPALLPKIVNLTIDNDYEIDVGRGKIMEIKFRDKPFN